MTFQFSKTSYLLSLLIIVLAAIAAAGGLLLDNLYNDNDFVKAAWFANDIITLWVVVPLLIVAVYFSHKGAMRWLLVWLGLMGYMVYNFSFYLFGAAFNIFFLVYVALVAVSLSAIVLQLSRLDVHGIAARFNKKLPIRWISGYLFFITGILLIVELGMILPFLVSGTLPATILLTGHPTSVVFALDFLLVIPLSLAAAILLWQRHSWGYVLGTIMLVKGFTYGLVLCTGTLLLARSEAYGNLDPLISLYIFLVLGGLGAGLLLLKNLE